MGDANSWLELNYLEVARAAQACSAHFTALLYSEIYVDKIKASTEESRRWPRPPILCHRPCSVLNGDGFFFLTLFFLDLFLYLGLRLCVVLRDRSKASRRINFEENSQTFTISSLTQKSTEDTGISLQVGHDNLSSYLCIYFYL